MHDSITLNQAVGQVLRELRVKHGLRLADLSERIGLSISALSRLEQGKVALTVNRLAVMCGILGTSPLAVLTNAQVRAFDTRQGKPAAAEQPHGNGLSPSPAADESFQPWSWVAENAHAVTRPGAQ